MKAAKNLTEHLVSPYHFSDKRRPGDRKKHTRSHTGSEWYTLVRGQMYNFPYNTFWQFTGDERNHPLLDTSEGARTENKSALSLFLSLVLSHEPKIS